MSQCPQCGAKAGGALDFGMTTCSQCGEIFLLGGTDSPVTKGPTQSRTEPDFLSPVKAKDLEEISPASSYDFSPATPEEIPEMAKPAEIEKPLPPPVSNPFSDVVDFGNRNLADTSTGGLVYDLTVEGIDTAMIRDQFLEILRDKRLGLDPLQSSKGIKNGAIGFHELNPVVAAVLANRLKFLGVKVSWIARQLVKAVLAFLISNQAVAGNYNRHLINLKGYISKMTASQEHLEALNHARDNTRDVKLKRELNEKIAKETENLKTMYMEFKIEQDHVHYEHPESGSEEMRRYLRYRPKKFVDTTDDANLDGKLTQIKEKLQFQYGLGPTPIVEPNKKPTPKPTKEELEKQKELELQKAEEEKKKKEGGGHGAPPPAPSGH